MEKLKNVSVADSIKDILQHAFIGGQEELRNELAKQGYDVTQSTVSRALKKLGAVRAYNESRQAYYVLPTEDLPPPVSATIVDMVQDIVSNENLIVVTTKPGSASLIARHIDYNADSVLGTVAGDDCILVIPQSVKKMNETIDELESLLDWRK